MPGQADPPKTRRRPGVAKAGQGGPEEKHPCVKTNLRSLPATNPATVTKIKAAKTSVHTLN